MIPPEVVRQVLVVVGFPVVDTRVGLSAFVADDHLRPGGFSGRGIDSNGKFVSLPRGTWPEDTRF